MDYPKCFQMALSKAIEMDNRVGVVFLRHGPFEVLDDATRVGILREFLDNYPDRFVAPLLAPFNSRGLEIPEWFERERPNLVVGVSAVKANLPDAVPFIYHTADHLPAGALGIEERTGDLARISVNLLSDMIWRGEFGKQAYPNSVRISPKWSG